MTERDKIANVLNSTEISQELSKEDIYKFADALIAAGLFADVRSLAEGNCVLYVKGRGFMRLYNEQDISRLIYRAEVAKKAAGLPVTLGDRVFCFIGTPPIVEEFEVEKIVIQKEFANLTFRGVNIDLGIVCFLSGYNKVWFTEREAAEAYLKELKEKNDD